MFTKDKNSIQKQTSSFRNEQTKREKKLIQLTNLCLQRVRAHLGGARACGLCCPIFPITSITSSTPVLLCSDQALFTKERSQTHTGSGQPSCLPPHNTPGKASGSSREARGMAPGWCRSRKPGRGCLRGQSSEPRGTHGTQSQAEAALQ